MTAQVNIKKFLAHLETSDGWGKDRANEFYTFCIANGKFKSNDRLVDSDVLTQAFEQFKERKEVHA